MVREAREGKPQRFITLTVNPSWFTSPEERAEKLVHAWRTIRRRFLDAKPGRECEFLAVFELTKLGEPHLHIIQRGSYMPQRWLSDQMTELMGAPIVDIRSVKGKTEVAKYVTKYISKRNIRIGTLKRYWRSKGYLKVSRAQLKRMRNARAVFYILDIPWKRYLKVVQARCPDMISEVRPHGFQFVWPEKLPPPWCVDQEPLAAKAA